MGVWYDYFVKWVGKDKDVPLETAWSNARESAWNKDKATGKTMYNEDSIKIVREQRRNNGWDQRLVGVQQVKPGENNWEALVNIFLFFVAFFQS